MDTEQIGAPAGSGILLKVLASSMHKLSQEALNHIFMGFSRLATQLGASIVQANDFATAATFMYDIAAGTVTQRDSNVAIAIKSIIARLLIGSGLVGGLDGAKDMDEKGLAAAIADARGISPVKLNKAYRELERLNLYPYMRNVLGMISRVDAENVGMRVQKLLDTMRSEHYDSVYDTAIELERMSTRRGLNQNFVRFMSDMYIYASNPLKIALFAAAHDSAGMDSYSAIVDGAVKRFTSLGSVKQSALYATLKRDSGICGVRCLERGDDGRYVANEDVWGLASWAAARGYRTIEEIARSGGEHAGLGTLTALLGAETRSKVPHSLSLYAIFDTISHNGYRPIARKEFMKSAEERGWNIDIRHALNMLSRSGIIDYIEGYYRGRVLDPDKDIRYRIVGESIGEAGIEALAKARPYIKGVIPRVVAAINAAGNKEGFSVYSIYESTGVFLQGVAKTVHGLAELGLIARDREEYLIVPKAAARIVWEEFFKPLGDIATYVACDSNINHGIVGAGIMCMRDNEWKHGNGNFDSALDSMIKRYAEAETRKPFRNSNGSGDSPRELVLHALERSDGLTRKQILESIAESDSRMNADRLSWYLLQLRREGRISLSEGKFRLSRQC
ncbi:MAG: hypothetical protein QXX90_03340 [Candidatus Micrarchaeaceae archaeon]